MTIPGNFRPRQEVRADGGFAWQDDFNFGIDRQKVIEKEVEDKYRPYVYEGLNDSDN